MLILSTALSSCSKSNMNIQSSEIETSTIITQDYDEYIQEENTPFYNNDNIFDDDNLYQTLKNDSNFMISNTECFTDYLESLGYGIWNLNDMNRGDYDTSYIYKFDQLYNMYGYDWALEHERISQK